MTVQQLEKGEAKVENQYARMVKEKGNKRAMETIFEVFEVTDRMWRGMDVIPTSGYEVKATYSNFDAKKKKDKTLKCRKCCKGGHLDVHCPIQADKKFGCIICHSDDLDHDSFSCPLLEQRCKTCN